MKSPKLLAIYILVFILLYTEMQNITWLLNEKYDHYASQDVEYPAKSFH